MVRFLTDEWVDALDRAVSRHAPGPTLEGLVVGYCIDDFTYHLVFAADRVRARGGAPDGATVTFRCDRSTATSVAQGTASAQRAFMAGWLRIGGDASALLRAQPAIAALPDLYGAIRDETDFGTGDTAADAREVQ